MLSSATTVNRSPAAGTPLSPSTSTGNEAARLDALDPIVEQRLQRALDRADHHQVADVQRAALDQHRRDGPRALSSFASTTAPTAGSMRVRLRLDLRLGHQLDGLSRSSMPSPVRAETGTASTSPPYSSTTTSCSASCCLTRSGLAVAVDLVEGDDDRHVGGAGVVDRFARLGHDAVVGSHHEHRDVGGLGAACAHRGERLVARRVQERDPAAVDLDLVGADVLGDAASLAGRDARLADRVQQAGLAVVDVAHDRHDRRPWLEQRWVLLLLGADAGLRQFGCARRSAWRPVQRAA